MEFDNLESYYKYIELDVSLEFDYSLSNKLQILAENISNKDVKTICFYELYFTNFSFQKGELIPKLHNNETGDSYPNLALFEDDLDYIKVRSENTLNPKYKAKYNHLLWLSKAKNIIYAKTAVDSYLSFLKVNIVSLEKIENQNLFESYYKNLFILSQNINYKIDEVIILAKSLIGNEKLNGFRECSMMKFIVDEGKKLDIKIIQTFYDYSISVIENDIYPDFLKEFLSFTIILCQKLKLKSHFYNNKLAEYYIKEADKQKENFFAHDYFLKALNEYKNAANHSKIEEVSTLIQEAKKNIDFKTISVEYQSDLLDAYWAFNDNKTSMIIENNSSEAIYTYLINGKILPEALKLEEFSRPVTFDFIKVVNFDINKNISTNKNSGINQYDLHLKNFSINHIWAIFLKGIKANKISLDSLIEYLTTKTWYSKNFTHTDSDGNIEGFDWIELIKPSIQNFFNQVNSDIINGVETKSGFILAIDSLVIKFEGLLREFSRLVGAQTIEIKENGTKERISFDKLLDNEKIVSIIPDTDIAFLKYLFTDKGLNLRNNIAHCFYNTEKYSTGIMLLLIVALLKLGDFEIKF